MEFKAIKLQLKEGAPEGSVLAVFSTFNVIDKDGDVTLPGAFEDGAPVRISSWGHKWYELPVGRGAIRVDEGKAMLDGRFFMDTTGGADTYRTVKGLEELQEWSYGYNVLESEDGEFEGQRARILKKLEVTEVSPVMRGAGVDTGTLAIKAQIKAWEDTENEIRHRLRDPGDFQEGSFRRITLQRDKPRVFGVIGKLKGETTTTLQALRFPKDDGWTMATAKKWLADHPDVAKGLAYEQEADIAAESLADVAAFVERSRSLADLRAKDGRTLSAANRDRLMTLLKALSEVGDDLGKLLKETEPVDTALFERLELEYQRTLAALPRAG
jgi:HK97 family phage prohead protease